MSNKIKTIYNNYDGLKLRNDYTYKAFATY